MACFLHLVATCARVIECGLKVYLREKFTHLPFIAFFLHWVHHKEFNSLYIWNTSDKYLGLENHLSLFLSQFSLLPSFLPFAFHLLYETKEMKWIILLVCECSFVEDTSLWILSPMLLTKQGSKLCFSELHHATKGVVQRQISGWPGPFSGTQQPNPTVQWDKQKLFKFPFAKCSQKLLPLALVMCSFLSLVIHTATFMCGFTWLITDHCTRG